MKVGAIFPQSDIHLDRAAVRDIAQTLEGLGFDHLLTYDHVLGADTSQRPGWSGFHDLDDQFCEAMVLLGFISAVTERIGLSTGIVCLPQRQTVLMAKQAAEVDRLSGGRMRLGVGIGWNKVEYDALGQDFHTRADRMEEQIVLLRRLWTEESVTFAGRFDKVDAAGICPLPIQRPIPVWIGSMLDRTIDRVARLADGWMPEYRKTELVKPQLEILEAKLAEHGRDRASFGLEARLSVKDGTPDDWRRTFEEWKSLAFTHFSVSTIWSGAKTVDEHLALFTRFTEEVGIHG